MAAPDIAPIERYINPGVTVVLWVPSIANIASPTRAELNAGTDLAEQVAESEGWQIESEQVQTPNLKTRYTGSIPGRRSAEDSSLTMDADKGGVDARQLMPRDEEGNIVWMDGGDVAGRLMDVFAVRVASQGKQRSVEGGDPARIVFQFSIIEEPAENVTIPA